MVLFNDLANKDINKNYTKSFQSVCKYLYKLQDCLNSVKQYFLAKQGGQSELGPSPLFPDMESPKQEQVGFLLPLACGHNRNPSESERMLFLMHLKLAGFVEPSDEINSGLKRLSRMGSLPALHNNLVPLIKP